MLYLENSAIKLCGGGGETYVCTSDESVDYYMVQVSKESSSKVDEIRERYAEALKKKDLAEAAKKKAEMELRKLKVPLYQPAHRSNIPCVPWCVCVCISG